MEDLKCSNWVWMENDCMLPLPYFPHGTSNSTQKCVKKAQCCSNLMWIMKTVEWNWTKNFWWMYSPWNPLSRRRFHLQHLFDSHWEIGPHLIFNFTSFSSLNWIEKNNNKKSYHNDCNSFFVSTAFDSINLK